MDPQSMRNQILTLRYTTLILAILVAVQLIWSLTRPDPSADFTEITVEKINVVDEKGNTRLLLAGGFPPRRTELAGLLFINEEGTEAGGLVYHGKTEDGKVSAGGILTMDQYNNDQIIALQYTDQNGQKRHGLTIMDRPDSLSPLVLEAYRVLDKMPPGPERDSVTQDYMSRISPDELGVRRLFVGRDQNRAAKVDLSDRMGKTRLRLIVDSLGDPQIQFMDAEGQIVRTIPE